MITENAGNEVYFKSELLKKDKRVVHFFTSRKGGYSSGKILGLNLGFRVGDDPAMVKKNYMKISKDQGIPFENIVAAKQTHSSDIRIITENEKGYGVSDPENLFEADGLITNVPNIPIMVFYADCVPVLLFDPKKCVIGAIHSGWRGTETEISKNAVSLMTETFGSDPKDIIASIGPSIGKCCFEVDGDVASKFSSDLSKELNDNKFKIDLWEANKRILQKSGILEDNIDVFGLCTYCNSDLLYSYRAHGEKTGRMGAGIMIKA